MHLKYAPRDFQVRELLDYPESPDGDYYVHLLKKQKMDTQDALSLICRKSRVQRENIAFAGLKDRQGETEQFISIKGRRVEFREPGIQLVFQGRSDQPIHSKQSRGNRFHIWLRRLDVESAHRIRDVLPRFVESGYVNYFDDQRFGCLRHGQGFPMRDVLAGRYEKALQRLIARPSPVAKGGDTRLKAILQERWGDWPVCAKIARGPVFQPVLQHLVRRGDDFKGAIQKLNTRTRLIQSFAYQSYLWNRAVSSMLDELVPTDLRMGIDSLMGELTSFADLPSDLITELASIQTPLWAPGSDGGDPRFDGETQRWLRSEQLSPELCEKNTLPGMVWRAEPRDLLVRPTKAYANRPERDARNRDTCNVEVAFCLPRGVYATMLIKHLIAGNLGPKSRSRPQRNRHSHD